MASSGRRADQWNTVRRELDWCSCRKDTLALLDIALCAEALRFLA